VAATDAVPPPAAAGPSAEPVAAQGVELHVPQLRVRCGASSVTVGPDAVEVRVGACVLRLTPDEVVLSAGPDARLRIEGQVATLAVGANSVRACRGVRQRGCAGGDLMAPLLHVGSVVLCEHGGRLVPLTASGRVRAGGRLVLTGGQACAMHGCPHRTPAGSPSPCSVACWPGGAARVRSQGRPVLLADTTGTCTPNATGTLVAQVQVRVRGC
jgi:hypothetical protein